MKQVSERRIPTLVTKDEKPTAVILPYDTYQELTQIREKHLRKVCENLEAWVVRNSESLKGLDSVKLVRETRESR